MKLKIFSLKALVLCGTMLMAHSGFTQQATGANDNREFDRQMNKLSEQMRDLQKQMNKLQTQEFKKRTKELSESARKLQSQVRTYTYENLSGLRGLGDVRVYIPTTPVVPGMPATPIAPHTQLAPLLNFNDADIKNKIENGELKEKVKTYSKSYSVDGNDKVQINNRYGKVTINTWNKNEVKVDIQMRAIANEEDDAQKMLDRVSITDSKENSVVSFKTNIESSSNTGNHTFIGTIFNGGKTTVHRMEINYTVYMPAKSQVQVNNRYGTTELPDLQGKVIIDHAYGSLVAKNLSNPANEISVKYGSANIENLNCSELTVAYGSLVLGEADRLNARVSYSSAKIGRLKTSGNINVRYSGGLQIADLDKSLKNLSVNSSYSNIKVGLGVNDNADFDVTTHYGSFNYDNNRAINVVNKTPADEERGWSSTKTYKGRLGKGNSDKLIVIRSNYGSVKFD